MLKKLAKSIREYKKDSILSGVFISLEVLMEVVIPVLMANLIDFGIDKGNMNIVIKMGIILLISALFSLLFGALSGRCAARASAGFAKNLRKDMYYNVQNYSFSNIDKFSTASIITRLTTDVTNVQNSYQMIIRVAVRAPIMMTFALIGSFRVDSKIPLIFLGLIPILGIGMVLIIKNAFPIFDNVFKTYDKLNKVVQENLLGIRVVKSFVLEDFEKDKFQSISNDIYKDFSKAERIVAFGMPLMQFCMYMAILLISWFGARAIVASGNNASIGLTTGALMSLFTYSTQILFSLMMIANVFVMMTIAKTSAQRIVEVLDEQTDIKSNEDFRNDVLNGDINFDNVCFSYSKDETKNVLKNINLNIKSGETIGIIGSTGSSKSTLVQLIPRLYDTTKGRVMVGGVDVRDYDLNILRDSVAVVLQKNVLFSGTINENMRWGNETATNEEIKHACEIACADEFIQNFEKKYDTYIEQGGSNVSGGQRQRLCIARALLKKPKILILDDSTSAVDTKTDAMIKKAFREELPDTTKIIIAQKVASVEDANRIVVMHDGEIVAIGSHEQLVDSCDIYNDIYTSQVKGGESDDSNK